VHTKAKLPITPRDSRKYDAVVYGATGFTGGLLAKHFTRTYGLGKTLKWAIGGRSQAKLQAVKNDLMKIDPAMKDLEFVIADSDNFDQLAAMCNQTKVVMSTVGPYALYGTLLVNACSLYGTDYTDITGEIDWNRENLRKFQGLALKSGARIISLCGHDSVPWDLTTMMVHNRLKSEHGENLSKIEFFNHAKGAFSGGSLATLYELINFGYYGNKSLPRTEDPWFCVPGKKSGNGFTLKNDNQWIMSYDWRRGVWKGFALMAVVNIEVVERSNCLLGWKDGISYSEAQVFPSPFMAYVLYAVFAMLFTSAACPPLAWFFRRFIIPQPGQGPDQDMLDNGYLRVLVEGRGDKGSVVNGVTTFKGDPGYRETARMLGESGLCFVFNNEELKLGGGMWTTASGLGNVLMKRLKDTGTTFDWYNPNDKVKAD